MLKNEVYIELTDLTETSKDHTCHFQVLSPRSDIGIYSSGRKKKKLKDPEKGGSDGSQADIKIEEQRDPALIVSFHCQCFVNISCVQWAVDFALF